MRNGGGHTPQRIRWRRSLSRQIDYSRDAAHDLLPERLTLSMKYPGLIHREIVLAQKNFELAHNC
jgi:hypothetical protein